VLHDRVLKKLRVHDRTADAALLEASYERTAPTLYALKAATSAETSRSLAAILMSADAGWWGSRFSSSSVNDSLEKERVQGGTAFPSMEHAIGGRSFPAIVFNPLVVIAMTLACHAGAIVRLKTHL
jgi:hypothetical protein